MGAPLLVGDAWATKSAKQVRQSPTPHPLSRVPHKHPTNRNRRRRSQQLQQNNAFQQQGMPPAHTASDTAKQKKAKKKHIKEKVHVITDGLVAAGNASYYMLAQILFFMVAISAFSAEDAWYGFLIKPFKAGIILYTLSMFLSVIAMVIAAIAMKRFLKKMHVLIVFLVCLSGAVALPVIPWAGVWILATVYSTFSKK